MAEALQRVSQIDLKEAHDPASDERSGLVPLMEDDSGHRFLVYTTDHGIDVRLRYDADKFWLTMQEMAVLFGRDLSVISRHVTSVISEGELAAEGTCKKCKKLALHPEGARLPFAA